MQKILLISLFCLMLPSQSFADDVTTKFNFDDSYQGEENAKGTDKSTIYDPFERANRKIFAFNEMLDKNVALPVVKQYRKSVPQVVRNSVKNFINNITTPFSVVSSLLQGDGQNSMASFSSFLINTTLGVGGIFDVAGNKNIKYHEEDLGQTFGKYGSKSGPYLVIPILGPSDVRDLSGSVVEKLISPFSFNRLEIGGSSNLISDEAAISLTATNGITARDSLIEVVDDMRKNSFDTYSTMRSAYLQRRQALINNK